MRRSSLPGPKKCSCPTNSSMVRGRIRAASGWALRRLASWMVWKRSMAPSPRSFLESRHFVGLRLGAELDPVGRGTHGNERARLGTFQDSTAFVAGQVFEDDGHVLVARLLA